MWKITESYFKVEWNHTRVDNHHLVKYGAIESSLEGDMNGLNRQSESSINSSEAFY